MEIICPLCNGLKETIEVCPNCNTSMHDAGPIENYFDDYSPYLDKNITQILNSTNPGNCVHVFKCNQCERDMRISISKEFH